MNKKALQKSLTAVIVIAVIGIIIFWLFLMPRRILMPKITMKRS